MKNKLSLLLIYISAAFLTAAMVLVLLGPFLWWNRLPTTPMNVWIVDKTVPIPDYREHKGLMWLLNNNKIINEKTGKFFRYDKDYFGFFPVNKGVYDIRNMPAEKELPDIIYLVDTYGVYTDDYLKPNVSGTRSDLIYGGLDNDELVKLKNNLGEGNTLIGEFNIGSSPTNQENREELEAIFGVHWTGWKGRYFNELQKDIEVPVWMVESYESHEKNNWGFKGPGYVLVSDDDEVVVLESKKHVGEKGLNMKFVQNYISEFEIQKDIRYSYWFEFINTEKDSETIANYFLDLTDDGKKIMDKLGLPAVFPAVVRKSNSEYTSYYFSGDFSDLKSVSKLWNYYGLDKVKGFTSYINKEAPDYLYWNGYVPLMNKILGDARDRQKQEKAAAKKDIEFISKVEGKDFYIFTNGKWQKKFLKGVNIGAGKPGAFPGDLAITKEDYLRWFKYIGEMNAEVIRVYTTLRPEFYDALYLYNKTAKKPLYLLQGVWVKEEDITELKDAYADEERIKSEFIKDASELVDIIHGNAILPERRGFASGEYKSDVSGYVIGWILGIEWDPDFVEGTDKNNPDKNSYEGKYVYTSNASPFEAFLCQVGDKVIEYEAGKYSMARPLSYSNWPTTDMLKHPNEPLAEEDAATVNLEHIKPRENFEPGVFASYHIYPYYPDFMNYQKEYTAFKDDSGKVDTYKAYLRDLINRHTMPVLVAEFGVPSSRGMTHVNVNMGYNQGKLSEQEQGIIGEMLLEDIYEEGYCGGLVFTWQDEWFKRTWNTMDFDLPDRRPFWSNPQTNEQQFGLLAFDPGESESICYVDGDVDDWKGDNPLQTSNNVKLYVKSDEKYVYLMANMDQFDFNKDTLAIPIDTIDGQGNKVGSNHLEFSRPADFVILINGRQNSRIVVDAYYDAFQYMYGKQLGMIKINPLFENKGSGIFNREYLCLSKEMLLPQDKTTIPFSKYETGLLTYGNANPKDSNFDSLSDFCVKDNKVEIRVPWQMLNVMDPSTRSIMDDIYLNKGFVSRKVDGIYFGAGLTDQNETIDMDFYSWETWLEPTYHERLKASYYILQNAFDRIK